MMPCLGFFLLHLDDGDGGNILIRIVIILVHGGPMSELIMTSQRRLILAEIRKCGTHPTADDIHKRVRRHLPRISLGTVYRNLDLLAESGAIQKVELPGKQKRFDANTSRHYHLRCIRCGRLEDASVDPIDDLENTLMEAKGYEILGHRLEFVGICPLCKGSDSGHEPEKDRGKEI